MKITAYAYEADIHCPDCTFRDASMGRLRLAVGAEFCPDEHGIADELRDRDGNPVHPIFEYEEIELTTCCDCGASIL